MKKGFFVYTSLLLVIVCLVSCKRKHECYCKITGTTNDVLTREYRGYSKKEATQLCKSEEYGSNALVEIKCTLL